MRVCHIIEPVFDDPNLVAFGGLPAVMGLGEQAGLHELVAQRYLASPEPRSADAVGRV